MYFGLHVNCLIFLSDFNHILSVSEGFHHNPSIKFYGNPSSGRLSDTCQHGQTRSDVHDEANSLFAIMQTRLKSID